MTDGDGKQVAAGAENALGRHYLDNAIAVFRSQKELGDRAMAQLDDAALFSAPNGESNSIAVIVRHVSGNMISRWTDFLTADGEKPERDRDAEFEAEVRDFPKGRDSVLQVWEEGWGRLFETLESLNPADLLRQVTIRQRPLSVMEAINRQISHYGYHVGQIVYLAKASRAGEWQTLSIGRGKSKGFRDAEDYQRR